MSNDSSSSIEPADQFQQCADCPFRLILGVPFGEHVLGDKLPAVVGEDFTQRVEMQNRIGVDDAGGVVGRLVRCVCRSQGMGQRFRAGHDEPAAGKRDRRREIIVDLQAERVFGSRGREDSSP